MTFLLSEKHRKKVLAVFAAALMVAFILPVTFGRQSQAPDRVIGRVGDRKVYYSELQAAEDQIRMLRQTTTRFSVPGLISQLPLLALLGENVDIFRVDNGFIPPPTVGQVAISRFANDPRLFLLMQIDALDAGIRVPNDLVEAWLRNQINLPESMTLEQEQALRQAVTNFLLVDLHMRRAADAVKVSEPLRVYREAYESQVITLDAAEITTGELVDQVAPPTADQLRQLYIRYGNRPRGNPDASNPMGFGYQLPDRVKLQYVGIDREELRRAAAASRPAARWDVEAAKYYTQNRQSFRKSPAPGQAPLEGDAAFQPFEEVRAEIVDRLQRDAVDQLTRALTQRLTQRLNSDYQAFVVGGGKGEYPHIGYLQTLAESLRREFNVNPRIESLTEAFRSAEELSALPGIGQATLPVRGRNEPMPFGVLATTRVKPNIAPDNTDRGAPVLEINQPSPLLTSDDGGIYFFRVTEAARAALPASVEQAEGIEDDFRKSAAYQLALDRARKIVEALPTFEGRLSDAAALHGEKIFPIGPIGETISSRELDLDDVAAAQFVTQALTLLRTDPAVESNPVRIVELPQAGRVYVVQLRDVITGITPEISPLVSEQVSRRIKRAMSQEMLQFWFDPANVRARTGYVAEGEDEIDELEAAAENTAAAPAPDGTQGEPAPLSNP